MRSRSTFGLICLLPAISLLLAAPVTVLAEDQTLEEKIVELEAKVQADPTDGKSWNDLGVLHAQEGHFDQARKLA